MLRNSDFFATLQKFRKTHGMRFFFKTLLLSLPVLAVACTKSPVEQALAHLDEAISRRADYIAAFERGNDSLRLELAAAYSDSVRWAASERLYQSYYHYSIDSAGHYVVRMQRWTASPQQEFLTRLSEVQLLAWSHDEARALMLYESLDTSIIMGDRQLRERYLARGIEVYNNLSRFPRFLAQQQDYPDSLRRLREEYIAIDTASYYGRKVLAQQLRDSGHLEDALELFMDSYRRAEKTDYHELTSIEYNTAMLYGQLENVDQKIIWLSRSAISDFRAPNRDFLSLYELAMTLYAGGDLKRARRYIRIHFTDVLAGDFQAHVIRSSRAQNMIAEAYMQAEHTKRMVLIISIIGLILLLAVILWLMHVSRRQAHNLSVANRALEDVNAALDSSNRSLAEANKIKDNYVFRYMDLSVSYLDKVESYRHVLRQIAKNKGTDALMAELRRPSEYSDYKRFYKVFDQTFLGIFPHFVEDVNALLREEARFDVPVGSRLPTEIRILAVIKLGIDDSPRIASFLNCSLSTVYTYRAKLRNLALCPKDEFELCIKAL